MSGENNQSFWTTLPGILTGIAAIITAIGGILLALNAVGVFDGNGDESPSPTVLPSPTASPSPTVSSPINGGVSRPTIESFDARPDKIVSGKNSTLSWSVSDATDVTITPEIGDVPLIGSEMVSPDTTTTYTITATNEAGSVESSINVVVDEPILSTPEQISPADGTVFDDYPNEITLEWTDVPGATIYGVEVEVYVGYWGNVITSYVTTNSYTFASTGRNPGRWRVWAVDSMDRKSEKTGWWGYSYTT